MLLRRMAIFGGAALALALAFALTASMPSDTKETVTANRLKNSDSPYLLKHADNPVDWHEWGPEALEKAKKEDKLIFLSIGYTACHWCNELEKECFEHQDFADVVNERYIAIKVDRERRPDLDAIYMRAAVALQGRGGWPNNVFLTPGLGPVYATGYQKREVFKDILVKVDEYWKENRDEVREGGVRITQLLKDSLERGGDFTPAASIDMAPLRKLMDNVHGGFGENSKFPMPSILEFLLVEGSDDDFLRTTLDNMSRGGMFDHVGGGFHRYSVDRKWEIPHFEKMLYDNALLAGLYARASVLLNKPEYGYTARKTLDFIERELKSPEGGFYSSLDADSGGGEGKFYTWTLDEIEKIAGDPSFASDYGVSAEGNMHEIFLTDWGAEQRPTGENTLRRMSAERHEEDLKKLLKERAERPRPPLDDKVVASWHALAVSAFAKAGVLLDDTRFLAMAEKGGRFTLDRLGFSHMWRNGKASGDATLDDAAYAAMAFWDLFEATGKDEYLAAAKLYADHAKNFSAGDGGYYLVQRAPDLIARPRVVEDSPSPSSAAVLARVDLRLATALNEPARAEDAGRTSAHLMGMLDGASPQAGEAMILFREVRAEKVEVVYAFESNEQNRADWLRNGYSRRWGVFRIPLGAKVIDPMLAEGRYPAAETAAYVCIDKKCLTPSRSPVEVKEGLKTIFGL